MYEAVSMLAHAALVHTLRLMTIDLHNNSILGWEWLLAKVANDLTVCTSTSGQGKLQATSVLGQEASISADARGAQAQVLRVLRCFDKHWKFPS